jgi:hypothetical protein
VSRFWWLAFAADAGEFLGVIITEAPSEAEAVQRTWRMGINPGGHVLAGELRDEYVPGFERRDQLLDRQVAYRLRDDINAMVGATEIGVPDPCGDSPSSPSSEA